MIVAVNGSAIPSVTSLRELSPPSALAASAVSRDAVASARAVASSWRRCAAVRLSASRRAPRVLPVADSAGTSAVSACFCCVCASAARSSGSFESFAGFWRFWVFVTGSVMIFRIASLCAKQTAKQTSSARIDTTSRLRSSLR